MNITMNKKGDIGKFTYVLLLSLALTALAAYLYLVVFKGGLERGGSGIIGEIEGLGDLDGDGVANKDDVCCAAACEARPSQVNSNPQSSFFGCTEYQGDTNCSSSRCFLDYDRDHIRNELDKCCAPQCKIESDEMVNMECPGSNCGCTSHQRPTACDAGPDAECEY
ncbi:hypothetical protein GF345_06630 [Candidatus Woesearchaeota archaeon]|nr:hypothetical protein [Candidatus Woesearchaeota archaeon]